MTRVAVVIPYYQRRTGILRRALDSVLSQVVPPNVTVKVVVVDDGSPATGRAEIEGLPACECIHIDLIEQANAGVAAARNAALQATIDCEYVAFLDSDDIWAPRHLCTALAALEYGLDFYFCDARRDGAADTYFTAATGFVDAFVPRHATRGEDDLFTLGPGRFFDFCLRSRPFQTSSVVYRRSAAPDMRFDTTLLSVGEDSLFFLQLIQKSRRVCCSTSVDVRCADGENIYYSQATWDAPGHLVRQFGKVLAADAFLRQLSLTRSDRAFLRRQRQADRLKFAFLSIRHVMKRRRLPSALATAAEHSGVRFWAWYLTSLAAVMTGYVLRLYSPVEQFDTSGTASLRVLIASSMPYLPQYYSGANADIDQLCRLLAARGHRVTVITGLLPIRWLGSLSRTRAFLSRLATGVRISSDRVNGYRVWRTWHVEEAMRYVVRRERADVVLVAAGETVRFAKAAIRAGVPVHMMLTDVEFGQQGGDFAELGRAPCTANSNFTAELYRAKFGVDSRVIYPLVQLEAYRTDTARRCVLFVNPHPMKGRDIALEIARRCPEIPFLFVKAWLLGAKLEAELVQALARLPNVELLDARDDMKSIYEQAKILLAPSLCYETYGRVVTEAQASGIPAVASDRGGLPEAVGPGGVIVDPEAPCDTWVCAVRRLWYDDECYAAMSEAALAYSQRPGNDLEAKADAWEEALLATVTHARAEKSLAIEGR